MDLLIFDLDGTLVDSREDIVASINWTIARLGGQQLPREVITAKVGSGVKPLLKQALPEELHAEALTQFNRHYLENLNVASAPFPGVPEMLGALEAIPKVVLTNKEKKFAQPLLRALKLQKYFRGIYSREDFDPKPSPIGVISLVNEFRARRDRTMIIGDMALDLQAGAEAGVKTCGALYGYGENLVSLRPTHLIYSALELVEIVKRP